MKSSLRTIWLVARRELRERAASRAFQISTALTIILVLGLLLVPSLLGLDGPPEYTIGTTGDSPATLPELVAASAPEPETTATAESFPTDEALRQAVLDGAVDIGVVDGTTVIVGPGTSSQLTALTTAVLATAGIEARAGSLGLDQDDLTMLVTGDVMVVEVENNEDETGRTIAAFAGTVLLFVSIVTYGQWILIGVVEEKSSRVVEVVLGAVRPRHLLAGKVVGIGLLGLAQLIVIAGMGVYIVRSTEQFDIPSLTFSLVAVVVGWFILGFTFFATGFAVAGSLVSRQEEAQNASFPLTILMLVGYIVSSTALGGGDNPALQALSLIPPFSPMTMPLRQASGTAAPWEVAVSVALMVVAITFMLRLGGRIYAGGLLKSGGKVKMREAFRSAET